VISGGTLTEVRANQPGLEYELLDCDNISQELMDNEEWPYDENKSINDIIDEKLKEKEKEYSEVLL
jgi:hypothetical protein